MDHSISSIRHVAGRDVYGSLVAAAAEAAAAALRRQTVNTLRPTSVRPSVRPMVGCAVVAWRGVRTSRTPSRLRRAACTNHRRHCGRRNSFLRCQSTPPGDVTQLDRRAVVTCRVGRREFWFIGWSKVAASPLRRRSRSASYPPPPGPADVTFPPPLPRPTS